jgi:hypothetical protein
VTNFPVGADAICVMLANKIFTKAGSQFSSYRAFSFRSSRDIPSGMQGGLWPHGRSVPFHFNEAKRLCLRD